MKYVYYELPTFSRYSFGFQTDTVREVCKLQQWILYGCSLDRCVLNFVVQIGQSQHVISIVKSSIFKSTNDNVPETDKYGIYAHVCKKFNVPHGTVTVDTQNTGSRDMQRATITCDEGYERNGTYRSFCMWKKWNKDPGKFVLSFFAFLSFLRVFAFFTEFGFRDIMLSIAV